MKTLKIELYDPAKIYYDQMEEETVSGQFLNEMVQRVAEKACAPFLVDDDVMREATKEEVEAHFAGKAKDALAMVEAFAENLRVLTGHTVHLSVSVHSGYPANADLFDASVALDAFSYGKRDTSQWREAKIADNVTLTFFGPTLPKTTK